MDIISDVVNEEVINTECGNFSGCGTDATAGGGINCGGSVTD